MAGESAVAVRPVVDAAELDVFIGLPRLLHHQERNWVQPVYRQAKSQLNVQTGGAAPSFERALFLAWRQGSPVGRIAATARPDDGDNGDGSFGHLETINDTAVSRVLLDSAARWLAGRGACRMIGPINGSPIDETGILIEGFDGRPAIGEGYNPAYYGRLLSDFGLQKREDFLAYHISYDDLDRDLANLPASLHRIARRIGTQPEVAVRSLRWATWDSDIVIAHRLYVDSHSTIPGHRGLSFDRFRSLAESFRPILDPDLALVVEVRGEPVGLAIALPDINEALHKVRDPDSLPGRIRLAWELRRIETLAFKLLGILPEYRGRGLESALVLEMARRAVDKRFERCEISLIREENTAMRRILERVGARVCRVYRVYEQSLAE